MVARSRSWLVSIAVLAASAHGFRDAAGLRGFLQGCNKYSNDCGRCVSKKGLLNVKKCKFVTLVDEGTGTGGTSKCVSTVSSRVLNHFEALADGTSQSVVTVPHGDTRSCPETSELSSSDMPNIRAHLKESDPALERSSEFSRLESGEPFDSNAAFCQAVRRSDEQQADSSGKSAVFVEPRKFADGGEPDGAIKQLLTNHLKRSYQARPWKAGALEGKSDGGIKASTASSDALRFVDNIMSVAKRASAKKLGPATGTCFLLSCLVGDAPKTSSPVFDAAVGHPIAKAHCSVCDMAGIVPHQLSGAVDQASQAVFEHICPRLTGDDEMGVPHSLQGPLLEFNTAFAALVGQDAGLSSIESEMNSAKSAIEAYLERHDTTASDIVDEAFDNFAFRSASRHRRGAKASRQKTMT